MLETGEYALVISHHFQIDIDFHRRPVQIAWVGIPTPPAWLPTYMLIKVPNSNHSKVYDYLQSDKLDYERM
jgi:hypothetical protein